MNHLPAPSADVSDPSLDQEALDQEALDQEALDQEALDREALDREEISVMVREALRQRIGGQSPIDTGGEDSTPAVIDESAKDVITEADLRDVQTGARVLIREGAIITPAARDLIRERGVE